MILTEEQRAALKRVVAYMDRMYAIASPYYGCAEDANLLRAMIDSSKHVTDHTKMIVFDLEKNRAAIDSAINSLLCEGWDNEASTVRRLVAEIERLRAENEEAQESLTAAYLLGSHEKAHEQAAKIKELEADVLQKSLLCDSIAENCNSLRNRAWKAEARIEELEADNQNLVTLNKSLMNNDWILRDNNRKYRKRALKAELLNKELNGKIGPDADAKPRVWQITEEREAAVDFALEYISDDANDSNDPGICFCVEALRAMLTEAGQ